MTQYGSIFVNLKAPSKKLEAPQIHLLKTALGPVCIIDFLVAISESVPEKFLRLYWICVRRPLKNADNVLQRVFKPAERQMQRHDNSALRALTRESPRYVIGYLIIVSHWQHETAILRDCILQNRPFLKNVFVSN